MPSIGYCFSRLSPLSLSRRDRRPPCYKNHVIRTFRRNFFRKIRTFRQPRKNIPPELKNIPPELFGNLHTKMQRKVARRSTRGSIRMVGRRAHYQGKACGARLSDAVPGYGECYPGLREVYVGPRRAMLGQATRCERKLREARVRCALLLGGGRALLA